MAILAPVDMGLPEMYIKYICIDYTSRLLMHASTVTARSENSSRLLRSTVATRRREAVERGSGTGDEVELPGRESVGLLLRIAMSGLRRSFKEHLSEHGIPWSVWYYLSVLWQHEGLSQKELIERVGMLQPNAVGSIQVMKELGLVRIERSEPDLRRTRIWLTAKGRKLERDLLPKVIERVDQIAFRNFTADEQKQLTQLLSRVCANVSALA
jgi:MarR family transcriptional regulator, organic hydroperoxide resistance regulator